MLVPIREKRLLCYDRSNRATSDGRLREQTLLSGEVFFQCPDSFPTDTLRRNATVLKQFPPDFLQFLTILLQFPPDFFALATDLKQFRAVSVVGFSGVFSDFPRVAAVRPSF